MTLIVGILCSDGVVMASDSAATYSSGVTPTIGQQEVTKVRKLGDGILFSSTGAVGISQITSAAVERLWNSREFAKPTIQSSADAMVRISQEIQRCVADILRSAGAVVPFVGGNVAGLTALSKSMIALPVRKKICLFQFDHSGAPEEATNELPFVALGSGQPIADPFLAFLKRILWKDHQPTVAEGRFAAAWTVRHVAQTIPGGVALPLQMASLSMDKDRHIIAFVDDPAEHYGMIEAAEGALRDHILNQGEIDSAPPVPKPKD